MPAGQSAIYYLSGASREALDREPRLELFRKNGVEVLYLYDMADEFVLESLGDYKEKKLVSADNVNPDDLNEIENAADSSDEDEDGDTESPADISAVIGRFKGVLGDRVIDVRVSERLVKSPACMMNKSSVFPKRVMELNAKHSLIKSLATIIAKDPTSDFVDRACEQLFEGCMLLDGYLNDPHTFIERVNQVLDEAASQRST
jgi:molecular chaperone HtpG